MYFTAERWSRIWAWGDARGLFADAEYELWICGQGACAATLTLGEARPQYSMYGLCRTAGHLALQSGADLLINPRSPAGTFTRYSFQARPWVSAPLLPSCAATVWRNQEYDPYLLSLRAMGRRRSCGRGLQGALAPARGTPGPWRTRPRVYSGQQDTAKNAGWLMLLSTAWPMIWNASSRRSAGRTRLFQPRDDRVILAVARALKIRPLRHGAPRHLRRRDGEVALTADSRRAGATGSRFSCRFSCGGRTSSTPLCM